MKRSLGSTSETQLAILVVAERWFAEIGFEKTTVADLALELRMSCSNIYRFFPSKSAINEAVARHVLNDVEVTVQELTNQEAAAGALLRAFIAAIEAKNAQRFLHRRKLHELVETAFNENWPIVREHVKKLDRGLAAIVAQGNKAGDFNVDDCDLAAMLIRSACLRFCHPRLMVECAEEPEPTLDQMLDFCLTALSREVLESTLDTQIPVNLARAPRSIAATG